MIIHSGEQMIWSEDELSPLCSRYLTGEYRAEALRLKNVRCRGDHFTAECAVAGGATDAFGRFHLSFVSATVLSSQLAIVSAHIDQGMRVKTGEVLLRDMSFTFHQQVFSPEFICDLDITLRRKVGNGMYYKMSFSVGDGSFTGTGSVLHLPVPEQA
ncbi:hypothetical protein [Streptomyces sp. NBC_01233]|uniref:hypothetical protein n=1 Tax=Streptomyces sp. NBC_01233 TaxID=2903787 RepID=UPI002E142B42|nr:hypothetical protein OG332_36415 [Streptomyces sp. NBC_01233]